VPFVVDVEPVVDGLALEVGDEPRHVDDCHGWEITVDPSTETPRLDHSRAARGRPYARGR
jgi:hypothetical protein